MKINIVPKITSNSRPGQLFVCWEKSLNLALVEFHGCDFKKINGIVFFPRILDPGLISGIGPLYSYRRKDKSLFVGCAIDFYVWKYAEDFKRSTLIMENLLESISAVKEIHADDDEKDRLFEIINLVGAQIGSKLR